MNWEAIGAVGEVLGALAVVVSLIYLAIQIRSSTNLARAQMFQAIASEQSRVVDAVTEQGHLVIFQKMQTGEELDRLEAVQANFIIARIVQAMLSVQAGYDNRQISKEFFLDAKQQTTNVLGGNVTRQARAYLERFHPNLKGSAIFEGVWRDADA